MPRRLMRRALACSLLAAGALALAGCGAGQPQISEAEEDRREVNERIAGVWRLTSYIPDETLSAVLLMGMQSDRILVRFEDSRVKSATTVLSFDRRYRIDLVTDKGFKMFIVDDEGVEYEVWGKFDSTGALLFNARTPPWTGNGKLEREGAALAVQ